MAKGDHLGEFEFLVLLALIRLKDNAYGMTIRREIAARTDRDVSIGAVYATLERLERKGYVRSWYADPTSERGGRAKHFFKLKGSGVRAVRDSRAAVASMLEGLEPSGG